MYEHFEPFEIAQVKPTNYFIDRCCFSMGQVANIQRDRLFVLGNIVDRGIAYLPLDARWHLILKRELPAILLNIDYIDVKFDVVRYGIWLTNARLAKTFGISPPGVVDQLKFGKPEDGSGLESGHI